MNPLRISAALACFAMVALAAGCASRPDEALKAAEQAKNQAKQLEAADFASADWNSAQKAWDDAQKALERQRYAEAAGLLTTARSRYEKSATIAKAKREDFRKDLTVMQTAVNKRLSELREDIGTSRATPKTKQELNAALVQIEGEVEKVNTQALNEQLIQARASAKDALEKLDQLATKVGAASKKR